LLFNKLMRGLMVAATLATFTSGCGGEGDSLVPPPLADSSDVMPRPLACGATARDQFSVLNDDNPDQYELRPPEGQHVTLVFSADYDAEFGVKLVVVDHTQKVVARKANPGEVGGPFSLRMTQSFVAQDGPFRLSVAPYTTRATIIDWEGDHGYHPLPIEASHYGWYSIQLTCTGP
jgi:hypothetical protein